jgi:site-specific DNA recombinase
MPFQFLTLVGYRNRDVYNGVDAHGRQLRSHVERVIDKAEARVVLRIFELYDAGYGLKRIAKLLTAEGAARPTPFRRADGLSPVGAWVPSTVRGVLTRELYHGVMVWIKTRKKNSWGKLDVRDRPESEWVRTPVEELRIVDEALWRRVSAHRSEIEDRAVRFGSGRLSGRPPKDAAKNLLAGLATCGVCGGGLVVERSGVTRRANGRRAFYICHRRRHHGTACTNTLRVPLADMNEAVLQAIEEHALTPEAVEQVIAMTERDDVRDQQDALRRERKNVEQRIARLVAALEMSGEVSSLVAKVRELEARLTTLDSDLTRLRPVPRVPSVVIEDRLAEWRRLLRQSTTQGRAVLQRVLKGRSVFSPTADGPGYTFEAPTRFDKLFAGVVVECPVWVDPNDDRGTANLTPEDTFDADYGRLLEQATVKGWCALQDSNLRPPGS